MRASMLPALPVVGNLFEFARDRIGFMHKLARTAEVTGFSIRGREIWMTSSPSIIHTMLVEKPDAFLKSGSLQWYGKPLMGEGLITTELPSHTRQRKLLSSSFTQKRIIQYAERMAQIAASLCDSWEDETKLDVGAEMTALALDTVGQILFGASLRGSAQDVVDALTVALHYLSSATVKLYVPPLSWPTLRNWHMRRAIRKLDEVVYRTIAARKSDTTDRGDVLSTLVAARDDEDGTGLTDQQMRDEVMTLMLAGHETTANALAWTFFLLGRSPSDYDRLQSEVRSVIGDRLATVEDLKNMPFAHAALKEAMRMYPPVYLIPRVARCDVEVGKYQLKAGQNLWINTIGMHHDPALFAEPSLFKPERFLGENEKSIPKGAYIPFGAGPRVCIGNHFAMLEAQIILTTIAARCRLSLLHPEQVRMEPLITLRPKKLHMRVTKTTA